MPKFYGDFHMHSALSPCGDNDMTPANIAGMATIKGLDMIALTDHNSARNLPAMVKAAQEYDLLVIPGIEASSREDVHIACYFPSVEKALIYSDRLYEALPDVKCNEELFGNQYIMDDDDNVLQSLDKLLISSTSFTSEEIIHDVRALGGVAIFAHIDKMYNSVLSSLGFIPPGLDVKTVELSKRVKDPIAYMQKNLNHIYHYLQSSDAHQLCDISEKEFFVELEERSVECFLQSLIRD